MAEVTGKGRSQPQLVAQRGDRSRHRHIGGPADRAKTNLRCEVGPQFVVHQHSVGQSAIAAERTDDDDRISVRPQVRVCLEERIQREERRHHGDMAGPSVSGSGPGPRRASEDGVAPFEANPLRPRRRQRMDACDERCPLDARRGRLTFVDVDQDTHLSRRIPGGHERAQAGMHRPAAVQRGRASERELRGDGKRVVAQRIPRKEPRHHLCGRHARAFDHSYARVAIST